MKQPRITLAKRHFAVRYIGFPFWCIWSVCYSAATDTILGSRHRARDQVAVKRPRCPLPVTRRNSATRYITRLMLLNQILYRLEKAELTSTCSSLRSHQRVTPEEPEGAAPSDRHDADTASTSAAYHASHGSDSEPVLCRTSGTVCRRRCICASNAVLRMHHCKT
jgi:hypothetical protein